MKKILCAVLALALLLAAAPALGEDVDWSAYTDAQLQELLKNDEKLLQELEEYTRQAEEMMEQIQAEQSRRGGGTPSPAPTEGFQHTPAAVKRSPDKYTWYVQDYVGRNAASIGYTSLGGDRLDRYGAGYLEFVFVTEDGTYLDYEDDAALRQYIVIDQSLKPNTEIKLVFQKDSKGREYDNLVDYQSIETMDLKVRRLDGKTAGKKVDADMVAIKASPDKHTWYMRNYVGKNVAAFGYTSWGGDRMDKYGAGYIKLNFVADDGAYLDPGNFDLLKQYVVTRQDVKPNAEIRFTFMKDSKGNEYSNLVQSQSYESITLYVRRLSGNP